jgi:hypothetical protein
VPLNRPPQPPASTTVIVEIEGLNEELLQAYWRAYDPAESPLAALIGASSSLVDDSRPQVSAIRVRAPIPATARSASLAALEGSLHAPLDAAFSGGSGACSAQSAEAAVVAGDSDAQRLENAQRTLRDSSMRRGLVIVRLDSLSVRPEVTPLEDQLAGLAALDPELSWLITTATGLEGAKVLVVGSPRAPDRAPPACFVEAGQVAELAGLKPQDVVAGSSYMVLRNLRSESMAGVAGVIACDSGAPLFETLYRHTQRGVEVFDPVIGRARPPTAYESANDLVLKIVATTRIGDTVGVSNSAMFGAQQLALDYGDVATPAVPAWLWSNEIGFGAGAALSPELIHREVLMLPGRPAGCAQPDEPSDALPFEDACHLALATGHDFVGTCATVLSIDRASRTSVARALLAAAPRGRPSPAAMHVAAWLSSTVAAATARSLKLPAPPRSERCAARRRPLLDRSIAADASRERWPELLREDPELCTLALDQASSQGESEQLAAIALRFTGATVVAWRYGGRSNTLTATPALAQWNGPKTIHDVAPDTKRALAQAPYLSNLALAVEAYAAGRIARAFSLLKPTPLGAFHDLPLAARRWHAFIHASTSDHHASLALSDKVKAAYAEVAREADQAALARVTEIVTDAHDVKPGATWAEGETAIWAAIHDDEPSDSSSPCDLRTDAEYKALLAAAQRLSGEHSGASAIIEARLGVHAPDAETQARHVAAALQLLRAPSAAWAGAEVRNTLLSVSMRSPLGEEVSRLRQLYLDRYVEEELRSKLPSYAERVANALRDDAARLDEATLLPRYTWLARDPSVRAVLRADLEKAWRSKLTWWLSALGVGAFAHERLASAALAGSSDDAADSRTPEALSSEAFDLVRNINELGFGSAYETLTKEDIERINDNMRRLRAASRIGSGANHKSSVAPTWEEHTARLKLLSAAGEAATAMLMHDVPRARRNLDVALSTLELMQAQQLETRAQKARLSSVLNLVREIAAIALYDGKTSEEREKISWAMESAEGHRRRVLENAREQTARVPTWLTAMEAAALDALWVVETMRNGRPSAKRLGETTPLWRRVVAEVAEAPSDLGPWVGLAPSLVRIHDALPRFASRNATLERNALLFLSLLHEDLTASFPERRMSAEFQDGNDGFLFPSLLVQAAHAAGSDHGSQAFLRRLMENTLGRLQNTDSANTRVRTTLAFTLAVFGKRDTELLGRAVDAWPDNEADAVFPAVLRPLMRARYAIEERAHMDKALADLLSVERSCPRLSWLADFARAELLGRAGRIEESASVFERYADGARRIKQDGRFGAAALDLEAELTWSGPAWTDSDGAANRYNASTSVTMALPGAERIGMSWEFGAGVATQAPPSDEFSNRPSWKLAVETAPRGTPSDAIALGHLRLFWHAVRANDLEHAERALLDLADMAQQTQPEAFDDVGELYVLWTAIAAEQLGLAYAGGRLRGVAARFADDEELESAECPIEHKVPANAALASFLERVRCNAPTELSELEGEEALRQVAYLRLRQSLLNEPADATWQAAVRKLSTKLRSLFGASTASPSWGRAAPCQAAATELQEGRVTGAATKCSDTWLRLWSSVQASLKAETAGAALGFVTSAVDELGSEPDEDAQRSNAIVAAFRGLMKRPDFASPLVDRAHALRVTLASSRHSELAAAIGINLMARDVLAGEAPRQAPLELLDQAQGMKWPLEHQALLRGLVFEPSSRDAHVQTARDLLSDDHAPSSEQGSP